MANDDRVPIWLDGAARTGAIYLVEHGRKVPTGADPGARVVRLDRPETAAHPAGCGCCGGRGGVEVALTGLFLERVRAPGPVSGGIVVSVSPDRIPAVAEACARDAFIRARYRLVGHWVAN